MKPYIVIAGTHGSGKTTTTNVLKPILEEILGEQVLIIPEIPRILKNLYGTKLNREGGVDTQYAIEKHYDIVEKIFSHMPLLADRSIFDRYAYSTASKLPLKDYYDVLVKVKSSMYSCVFYLNQEVPLVCDGVRDKDLDYRDEIDGLIKTYLEDSGVEYFELKGSVSQRVAQAREILEMKFKAKK